MVERSWGIVRQFRWWTLIVAVCLGLVVWQWLDGRIGPDPTVSPAGLAINRSLPSPMTGMVLNLGELDCQSGTEASLVVKGELRLPQTCSLSLEYENIGAAEPVEEGQDCVFDPRDFLALIDHQGRHYSPAEADCPLAGQDWSSEDSGRLLTTVSFNLTAEAAADRLLAAGQLIDFDRPDQVEAAVALGESFSDGQGSIDYSVRDLSCQRLADVDSSDVSLWWRRLTNDVNNDRYNPDRNLTIGRVRKQWQVCKLEVDYTNTGGGADWIWSDSCRLAVYRHSRLIDERGRQHLALADHVCQPGEVAWPAGDTGSEQIEFLVDRWAKIERILIAGQLVDPSRR